MGNVLVSWKIIYLTHFPLSLSLSLSLSLIHTFTPHTLSLSLSISYYLSLSLSCVIKFPRKFLRYFCTFLLQREEISSDDKIVRFESQRKLNPSLERDSFLGLSDITFAFFQYQGRWKVVGTFSAQVRANSI